MATVKKHYDDVLSSVYSWMFGGFESGIEQSSKFINTHHLEPRGSGEAIDLGSGCGFLSIPLAKAGYSVTAIDLDSGLLRELRDNCHGLKVKTIQADLVDFDTVVNESAELIVCMTDTILHLQSKLEVSSLFTKVFSALEPEGRFIITFRDLTYELTDEDRFIPVRSDENIIFTCFLEYEPGAVKVNDVIYKKSSDGWSFVKGSYRKLRLDTGWVATELIKTGFKVTHLKEENGFITVIGTK